MNSKGKYHISVFHLIFLFCGTFSFNASAKGLQNLVQYMNFVDRAIFQHPRVEEFRLILYRQNDGEYCDQIRPDKARKWLKNKVSGIMKDSTADSVTREKIQNLESAALQEFGDSFVSYWISYCQKSELTPFGINEVHSFESNNQMMLFTYRENF